MNPPPEIEELVLSYIKARYDLEREIAGVLTPRSSAVEVQGRMRELAETGGIERLESKYRNILAQFCTRQDHGPDISFSSVPNHHPELEKITDFKVIDEGRAQVCTEYLPQNSYPRPRRYEVEFSGGQWRISQYYLLDPDGEFEERPEL
jgi:hypothetical protein